MHVGVHIDDLTQEVYEDNDDDAVAVLLESGQALVKTFEGYLKLPFADLKCNVVGSSNSAVKKVVNLYPKLGKGVSSVRDLGVDYNAGKSEMPRKAGRSWQPDFVKARGLSQDA